MIKYLVVVLLLLISFVAVAQIIDGGNHNVRWMSADGTELFGIGGVTVYHSLDGGTTWSTLHVFAMTIDVMRQMDNGELLVTLVGTGPGETWLSTGYKTLGASAVWNRVLINQGGIGTHTTFWGLNCYQNICVSTEYLSLKTDPNDKARYVYLSTDYGQTWHIIFDLEALNGLSNGCHMHGVTYDPFWQAIWVLNGDPPCSALHVSFDMGQTWTQVVTSSTYTTVVATANVVLLGSDNSPNGISRMVKTGWHTYTSPTFAFALDNSALNNYISTQPYWHQRNSTYPIIFPFEANNTLAGTAVITWDGYTFNQIWTDTITYTTRGLLTLVGPDVNGHLIGDLFDNRQSNDSRLTLTAPTGQAGSLVKRGLILSGLIRQ